MAVDQGVIIKSAKEGFGSPQTSVTGFTSELIAAWLRDPLSLDEWGGVISNQNPILNRRHSIYFIARGFGKKEK